MESAPGKLENEIRRIVVDLAGISDDFDASAHLYLDLAVPSIAAMELLLELESRYQIKIADDQFVEAETLAAITALVQRLLDQRH